MSVASQTKAILKKLGVTSRVQAASTSGSASPQSGPCTRPMRRTLGPVT